MKMLLPRTYMSGFVSVSTFASVPASNTRLARLTALHRSVNSSYTKCLDVCTSVGAAAVHPSSVGQRHTQ